MTSMDKVYYFYKPSREGSFLQELLATLLEGVLVSDFFTAYDSLKCGQQKCLVHLVRDIDDDLMKNPLDTELKSIARDFGVLLRKIIETVDQSWSQAPLSPQTQASRGSVLGFSGVSRFLVAFSQQTTKAISEKRRKDVHVPGP